MAHQTHQAHQSWAISRFRLLSDFTQSTRTPKPSRMSWRCSANRKGWDPGIVEGKETDAQRDSLRGEFLGSMDSCVECEPILPIGHISSSPPISSAGQSPPLQTAGRGKDRSECNRCRRSWVRSHASWLCRAVSPCSISSSTDTDAMPCHAPKCPVIMVRSNVCEHHFTL